MIASIASSTKIIELDSLTVDILDDAIVFLAGKHASVAVIQDPRECPEWSTVINALKRKRAVNIFDKISPNPKTTDIMEMANAASRSKPDVIIGFGGGSSLDSAKAVSLILENGGDLDEYLGPDARKKPEKRGPKTILIPTTAGTGSEVTRFGVYTTRKGKKRTLATTYIQPDVGLLVSSFVSELPPRLLAATSYDAITHALETLWNKNATESSDAIAVDALVKLIKNFESSYSARTRGERINASDLLAAACEAGIAFNVTGTAAIHALSFVVSEEWGLPHGEACAFFAESVYDLCSKDHSVSEKLADAAASLWGEEARENGVARIRERLIELRKLAGLPSKFREIEESRTTDELFPLFEGCLDDPKMRNNAVAINRDMLRVIIDGKTR